MKSLEAWQSQEHPVFFDGRMHFPFFLLRKIYNNYNEFKLLNQVILKDEKCTLLDLGCATGELFRYFKHNFPNIDYAGCDISRPAIERAKIKYPQGEFFVIDHEMSQVRERKPDYVFNRDVVMHQPDPFEFLKLVCTIPQKGLFLRLRTRDQGKTELDIEKSCQKHYGGWVPYVVLNCDEIISLLKSLKICSKVVLWKNYMLLGGVNHRYLPKDCYLESTGTAETAMYIELSKDSQNLEVISKEVIDGNFVSLFDRAVYKIMKHSIGLRWKSRIWW